MAIEKWLAVTSVALFAMFAGEIFTVYNFLINIPDDDAYLQAFSPNEKIFQFISIGVAPAGILAAVAYIMSKQYGSKPIGSMIIIGGIILLVGMLVSYSLIDNIDDVYLTDIVKFTPLLFMVLSIPVIVVGAYLIKPKKRRPKKEFF